MGDTIIFTKYFGGGLTRGPTSMNLVVTHTTFWYDSMGDVIRQASNLADLDGEVQQNLMIKEANDGQHLKDDAALALNNKNIATHIWNPVK